MQRSILKRFAILILSVTMIFGTSVSAFATEVPTNIQTDVMEQTLVEVSENSVVTLNTAASGTCDAFETIVLRPTLSSYIGLTKTLQFTASSVGSNPSVSGYLMVQVKKPNGNILDTFIANPDETYEGSFFLPSSGTYTVTIQSYYRYPLNCNVTWL